MKKNFLRFGLVYGFAFTASWLGAGVVKIELPGETDSFKPGRGSEIANGQCLICHSVEYVSTQPPSLKTFWAGSIKKMREKYGAVIPDEQVEPLLDYLTAHYGAGTNSAPTATTNAAITSSSPPATGASSPPSGPSVAMKYNCLGCHTVTAKLIGPAYKDIAEKYRSDANAREKVAEQIRNGGSGKWGPVIMPPFPQVSAEETKVLTEWILSRK